MKLLPSRQHEHSEQVTPFAGVWIEIHSQVAMDFMDLVTPFAGVWIEMEEKLPEKHPQRVTPFAGVWIEIPLQ